MDLIREELLRQKKALELLLLGANAQPESVTPPEKVELSSFAVREAWKSPAAPEARDLPPAGRWVIRSSEEEKSDMVAGARLSEAGETARTSFGAAALTAPARTALPGGGLRDPAAEGGRLVTEYVLAGRPARTGAWELSRLIERDARRYDGGFSS